MLEHKQNSLMDYNTWTHQTYIHQVLADTGYCPEGLTRAMADRDRWQKRIKEIYADGTPKSWWIKFCAEIQKFNIF